MSATLFRRRTSGAARICESGNRPFSRPHASPSVGGRSWEATPGSGARGRRNWAFAQALTAAGFWGLSGTAAQALFQVFGVPPGTLLSVRMLLSGVVLRIVRRPARPRGELRRMLPFSILGLYGVQVTFFVAIDVSNAATTTLLQTLSLPMMALYEAVGEQRTVTFRWAVAVGIALRGMVLVVSGRARLALEVTPMGRPSGFSRPSWPRTTRSPHGR